MCDYSLMDLESRLAVDGEELEVYRFSCGAKGLIAAQPDTSVQSFWRNPRRFWNRQPKTCVVCIPAGARLILYDLPASLQRRLDIGRVEEVVFEQLHPEAGAFRDAIRFENGRVLLLQDLPVGERLRVLSFSPPQDVAIDAPEEMFRLAA